MRSESEINRKIDELLGEAERYKFWDTRTILVLTAYIIVALELLFMGCICTPIFLFVLIAFVLMYFRFSINYEKKTWKKKYILTLAKTLHDAVEVMKKPGGDDEVYDFLDSLIIKHAASGKKSKTRLARIKALTWIVTPEAGKPE